MDDHEPGAAIPPPPPPPPPLPAAVPLEPPAAAARRGRGRVWLALVAVAGLIGLAVAVVDGGADRDPDRALASAQALVAEATSFRFTIGYTIDGYIDPTVAFESDEDQRDEPPAREQATVTGAGEFATPNWHAKGHSDFGGETEWYEAMLVDGVLYDRSDASEEELADSEYWVDDDYLGEGTREDVLEELSSWRSDPMLSEVPGLDDELEVIIASFMYLTGFGDQVASNLEVDPKGYLDAVASLADPTTASQDGDTLTLKVQMEPAADVIDAFGGPLPAADLEIDLDGDDRPAALRLSVSKGEVTLTAAIGFSDWGADIDISAPPEDQVRDTYDDERFDEVGEAIDDPDLEELEGFDDDFDGTLREDGGGVEVVTPGDQPTDGQSAVTADEIRRLRLPPGVSLLRPATMPDGIELVEVSVDPTYSCGWVSLWFEGNAGFMVVRLRSEKCALDADPTSFQPGPYDHPSRQTGDGVELLVEGTVVWIDTGDNRANEEALRSLQPTSLDELATEVDAAQ